jgi:hypothetical protein
MNGIGQGGDVVRKPKHLEPTEVSVRIAAAAARLDAIAERRDAAFEAMKERYGGPDGDPNRWIRHIDEMGREVTEVVPDAWPELRPDFDAIAEAWLAADAAWRESISRSLRHHLSLRDGHLGLVSHVASTLKQKRDGRALRRAVAVAAMGAGGSDFRDASLVLARLVRAARAARIDAAREFARVADLASADEGWGGSRASAAETLRGFCKSVT